MRLALPRSALLIAASVVLSGALLHVGTGLHPVWWVAMLAPLPVLWAAPRLGGRAAFGAAVLAWALGALNEWTYLRSLHLPTPVVVLATAIPALIFGLAVALFRAFLLRGAALRAAVSVPVVWVAWELVASRTNGHGTFGSLAYTQMDDLPVLQLASALGCCGVAFAVLFFPAAAAAISSLPRAPRLRLLCATGAAAAGVLGYGAWRLRPELAPSPSVTVGLAASDLPESVRIERAGAGVRVLRDYLHRAEELAGRGAQVVVVPEKLAELEGGEASAADVAWQALADSSGAILVVGVVRSDGDGRRNEARVYRAGVPVPASYVKRHLVPGWEASFTPGRDRLSVNHPDGIFGVAVCKDMDFPETIRAYRADGIGLMLVPAWDFDRDGSLHARMAVLRGVEGGFGVVRSAKQGMLTVSDDRGRVLAERRSADGPFPTLLAAAQLGHGPTIYARVGDAFGWANLVALAALVLSLLRRTKPQSVAVAPATPA